jgi:hypothetical protein
MKFHWFAEVTYGHLPKDFPQKHRSAWVDPPVSLMDPVKVGETYRMFIRLMEHADKMGFDGLAVNEHHQTAFAMTPSPNLLAATLASNTENAAILVIGDSLALYNPPTRIAEEMAYLDCLSGGRLIEGPFPPERSVRVLRVQGALRRMPVPGVCHDRRLYAGRPSLHLPAYRSAVDRAVPGVER